MSRDEKDLEEAHRVQKICDYRLIVEDGLGSEEAWEEWEDSDLAVDQFIKELRIREGSFRLYIKDAAD